MLGVGLGSERTGEFDPERFGEEGDPRARARLLDEGLERLHGLLGRASSSRGRSSSRGSRSGWPRAGRTGARCAAPRAGTACSRSTCPGPEALAELVAEMRELRGPDGYELVVDNPAGTDSAAWVEAGATWCLTGFGIQPTADEVGDVIDGELT